MKTLKANKFFFGIVATFFLFFLFFTFFSRIVRAAVPSIINTQPRVAIIAIESNGIIDRSILVDRIPVINVSHSIIG